MSQSARTPETTASHGDAASAAHHHPAHHAHAGAGHIGHTHSDGRGLVLFQAAALGLALVLLVTTSGSPWFGTLSVVFVSIVLEALPFVLLGAIVSGIIEVFVPRDAITRWLPGKSTGTVLLAGFLGVIFPVCECAVVPVVRRLTKKGVPLAAAVAYLLAGPIVNPIVATSTAVAYSFDWNIVFVRLLAGYAIAVAVGSLIGDFFNARTALLPAAQHDDDHAHDCALCAAAEKPSLISRGRAVLAHTIDDFLDVGRFLILGAFFAGLAQSLIDREALTLLMSTPSLSIGLMMSLAFGLNLCSEADAFVAASFRGTVPLAAQMAFMVLGPMLDIKLLIMYLGLFRRQVIATIATTVTVMVFLTMWLMNWLAGGV